MDIRIDDDLFVRCRQNTGEFEWQKKIVIIYCDNFCFVASTAGGGWLIQKDDCAR